MNILKQLIQIPSRSGNEETIQQFILDNCKKHTSDTQRIGENVLVHIAGSDNTKALLFNAHVDTVSEGNLNQWDYPPFEGKIVGDTIFGLGASDEKATVAVFLELIAYYSEHTPPCDLWFMFVVNEEIDGSGSEEVLEWFSINRQSQYEYLAGILGEPTGLTEIELGHKANIFLKATTHGDSGHSSMPDKIKEHAVLKMYDVHKKLILLSDEWGEKYADTLLGKPSVGMFTTIQAGSSLNKFPDTCTATFDVRATPKLYDHIQDELKKISNCEWQFAEKPVPYGLTKETEEIVKIAKQVTGVKIVPSPWSNDMCFFTQKQIPALVFGPGERDVIHKPNEFCYLSKIHKAKELYKEIIKRF
ncbi:M20 family metallopeptidase [Candidatus Roizmanbacteria bacterium]|nr:M20 family metallopeptidase [Candidatus Roizmanbacteria bacterium]